MPAKRRRSKSPVPGGSTTKKRVQRTYSVPDARFNLPQTLQTSSAPGTPIGTCHKSQRKTVRFEQNLKGIVCLDSVKIQTSIQCFSQVRRS